MISNKMHKDARVIFERSEAGRQAGAQFPEPANNNSKNSARQVVWQDLGATMLRKKPPGLPEVSELDAVRHYTGLSSKNFSIDTHFYPLGSCTMKYNPRGAQHAALLPGFKDRHPLLPDAVNQGLLSSIFDLQEILKDITGMRGVSLSPMAGAQGEFAGVAMIRAYHEARNDPRTEILVANAAHGTNPATAVMCGYQVREVALDAEGDIDLGALKAAVGPQTAGLMMTNPSTCGVFEKEIQQIAACVHDAGGLLYYDGANLNAILGKVKPGDMGFDVLHMNLHKTFATPHGGGGPGAGPVGVAERLLPYLPTPLVRQESTGAHAKYQWTCDSDTPLSIGRLSAFMGNAGILLRALAYVRMLGRDGVHRVGEFATLNANYLAAKLQQAGFDLAYENRRASHEFVLSFARQKKELGVTAMDFAKRLLDYGVHAPTTYFPLLIPECFLIEPTETESKQEIDHFVEALIQIQKEAETEPELLRTAPHTLPVKRLDEVKAARDLDLAWKA